MEEGVPDGGLVAGTRLQQGLETRNKEIEPSECVVGFNSGLLQSLTSFSNIEPE